jgi:hypothetical protein
MVNIVIETACCEFTPVKAKGKLICGPPRSGRLEMNVL